MTELKYNMPNDIYTYSITCPDDMLNLYLDLLILNGAYKIYKDNEVIYNG